MNRGFSGRPLTEARQLGLCFPDNTGYAIGSALIRAVRAHHPRLSWAALTRMATQELLDKLQEFIAGPGPRKWLLVELARLPALRQALGNSVRLRVIESRNNKFALAVAEPRVAVPGEAPPALQPPPGPFGAPP